MAKIIKCADASGQHWFHCSPGKEKSLYRQLTADGLSEPSDEPLRCGPELSLTLAKQLVGGHSLSVAKTDASNWTKLLKILEADGFEQKIPVEPGKIVVPRTRLRKFRFAYRDWTQGLKRSQAEFFANNVDCLAELWNLSLKELARYDYQAPFHDSKRKVGSGKPKPLSSIKNTIEAGVYFDSDFTTIQTIAGIKFVYLDREIAPLRTPGAQFVDGGAATSSGRGGMDLLLLAEGRVCAGEIKVGKDSELFEALLQAMWYGSELATKQQFARVAKHYRPGGIQGTKIDIAVFSINQKKKDPTRAATTQLAQQIQNSGKFKNLGRIYLFENDGNQWRTII